MQKTFIYTAVAVLSGSLLASSAVAATVSYRVSIDGNSAISQPQLAPGLHNLVVEAIVTDNDLTGGGVHGGLFQSAFDLSTDNNGFTFLDNTGGFLGAPNGTWDSADLIPPFDTHNQGVTTNGGGPTVIAETHAIAPGNFNTKFNAVGANMFSVVATGQFNYSGGLHPASLDLVVANPFGGDIVVSTLSGGNVVGALPDEVNNYTITFESGNLPPSVTPDAGLRGTGPDKIFTQQFDFTDDNDVSLDWTIDSFTGPTVPANFGIDANGLFTWDTTGVPGGFDQVYSLVVRGTDSGDLFDVGSIEIILPEPGTLVLAGLSLIGFVAVRRKQA